MIRIIGVVRVLLFVVAKCCNQPRDNSIWLSSNFAERGEGYAFDPVFLLLAELQDVVNHQVRAGSNKAQGTDRVNLATNFVLTCNSQQSIDTVRYHRIRRRAD